MDGKRSSVPIRPALVCNQAAAAVEACCAGLGLGSFLHYQIRDAAADGRLETVLVNHELPASPVNVVLPESRLAPPRVRRLAVALSEGIGLSLRGADWKAAQAGV